MAALTFLFPMNLDLQSAWYLASAACRSLTAPCILNLASPPHLSFLSLHFWRRISFTLSPVLALSTWRNRYAFLQRPGFLAGFSTLHWSPQNRQLLMNENSELLRRFGEAWAFVSTSPFRFRCLYLLAQCICWYTVSMTLYSKWRIMFQFHFKYSINTILISFTTTIDDCFYSQFSSCCELIWPFLTAKYIFKETLLHRC